jgi:hypothetical protein
MSTFDPSWLMSQLSKATGSATPSDNFSGSNPNNVFPRSNNSTPDAPDAPPPVASAPPSAPPPSQPPPGAPPQAQPNPAQQRLQGVKGYLANILHGVGEGMKTELGMETDAQKQQRLFTQDLQTKQLQNQQQNIQSEIMQRAAVVKQMQSSVTLPNGMQVPFALAKPYIDAWGKQNAAATGKRYMIVPNVGMLDTQPEGGGNPTLVPGSSPQGVKVTPEIAQQYNIPLQLVGTSMPLGQFAQLERGGAAWAGNVSNTTETKELADGSLVQIPKTTTSQKVTPKNGSSVMPSATPQGPGRQPVQPTAQGQNKPPLALNTRGGVKTLVGPDGQPLQGKSAADTVYATDPTTGQTTFTTRTAAPPGSIVQKVTPAQSRKDQGLSNKMADVQRKIGDYIDSFQQPLDDQDQKAIAYLMQNPMPESVAHMGSIPLAGFANNLLKARGMQALSPAGVQRLVAFNQARESLAGYQTVLTGSSKGSDTIFHLQEDQLPPPLADGDYAKTAGTEFQKNLDIAGQHMPIFPGKDETQQSVKAQQQATRNARNPQASPAAEPPRPANVPANYVFKADGPKGTGWYKP